MITAAQRLKMSAAIVRWEVRRDHRGRIMVYRPPAEDGGGSYEVAGINVRYHPKTAPYLRRLVEEGRDAEVLAAASAHILEYTNAVSSWAEEAAIEAYLRDICFNRGPTGAAKILQHALSVTVDGVVGPQTLRACQRTNPEQLLLDLRASREWYERQYMHRDEHHPFWRGLVARWDRALTFARGFLTPTAPHTGSV